MNKGVLKIRSQKPFFYRILANLGYLTHNKNYFLTFYSYTRSLWHKSCWKWVICRVQTQFPANRKITQRKSNKPFLSPPDLLLLFWTSVVNFHWGSLVSDLLFRKRAQPVVPVSWPSLGAFDDDQGQGKGCQSDKSPREPPYSFKVANSLKVRLFNI